MARLPAGIDAQSFGLLPVAPGLGAIRLDPDDVDAFAAAHPELALEVSPPRMPLLDKSTVWTRAAAYRNATGHGGAGVIVGIIDTGVDVTHPDFRDKDGKTRIAWMLNAESPRALQPALETKFGCNASSQTPCAIYSESDLNQMLVANDPSVPRDVRGHGTHVASIAAGNGGPMITMYPMLIGVAPEAKLIVVNPSTSGGFRDPDILNAARFIFDRADAMGMPAAVNLSVGGDFGPHDGTSNLEAGLAAMVGDQKPGRVIVVAGGNSGALSSVGDRGPFGVHTEVRVPRNAVTRVPILTPDAKTRGKGFVWITFRPGDEVSVGLEGPGGESWIGLTAPGDESGYSGSGDTTAGIINNVVNGKTSITAETNSAVVVWDGAWQKGEFGILMSGKGDAQLWVVGQGDVAPSVSSGLLFEKAVRQGTVTVPASHPGLLAVGCTLNRVSWDPLFGPPLKLTLVGGVENPVPDSTCYFSGAGPMPFGTPKPDISAPGGFVVAAMSHDADPGVNPGGLFDAAGCPTPEPCYVVDDFHAVTAGTSMAAPHVTGAAALLLQADPTLTQARVTEVLQAGARYPQGMVLSEQQLGAGALDLEGARQAMAEEQSSSIAPDVSKSWYTLSSPYARPDPSWPVWGTVELRRANGDVASGLDGTALHLSVQGGVITQPLTKVRHGLFRFSVAGAKGSGGGEMTVDVTYDGASLGPSRTLPIGTDVWTVNGGVDATSGSCACSPASVARASRRPWGGLSAALVAIALGGLRRRRGRVPCRSVDGDRS